MVTDLSGFCRRFRTYRVRQRTYRVLFPDSVTQNEPNRRKEVVSVYVYTITEGTDDLSLQNFSFCFGTTLGFFKELHTKQDNRPNTATNGVVSVQIHSILECGLFVLLYFMQNTY